MTKLHYSMAAVYCADALPDIGGCRDMFCTGNNCEMICKLSIGVLHSV